MLPRSGRLQLPPELIDDDWRDVADELFEMAADGRRAEDERRIAAHYAVAVADLPPVPTAQPKEGADLDPWVRSLADEWEAVRELTGGAALRARLLLALDHLGEPDGWRAPDAKLERWIHTHTGRAPPSSADQRADLRRGVEEDDVTALLLRLADLPEDIDLLGLLGRISRHGGEHGSAIVRALPVGELQRSVGTRGELGAGQVVVPCLEIGRILDLVSNSRLAMPRH